ncbi:MAG: hypothetical protein ACRENQ_00385 [Gemmatimonadaceae bacterium]
MSRVALIKVVLAAAGIVVWGYGTRTDNAHLRLAGMIVLVVAVALRLLPRSLRNRIDGRRDESGSSQR